jgi:nifR3 family TIM-barrel protein
MKIGNVDIGQGLVLAPIAGVTDLPFRLLCRENGADLVYTELISAAAVTRNPDRSARYFMTSGAERPVAAQIFGADPAEMADAATMLSSQDVDLIDINMGCPVKKVVRAGAGAALLRDLPRARSIIRAVIGAVSKPVTVKFRSGWDASSICAVDLARMAQEEGVAALALHPRTKAQGFTGQAIWDHIGQIKDAVSIPVIGNGDIRTVNDAARMLRDTACDGVMVGRSAMGDPWIFGRIRAFLLTGSRALKPQPEEIERTFVRHLQMEVKLFGEKQGVVRMRKFAAWYTKGLFQSAEFRGRINRIVSYDEFLATVEAYFSQIMDRTSVRPL